jgi:hypothetical protein
MKNIIQLFILIFAFSSSHAQSVDSTTVKKNSFTIDIGYAHSRQIIGMNILGTSFKSSGVFQQFQYTRNLHRYFDAYVGFSMYLILPSTSNYNSDLFAVENFKYIERENSIAVFAGINGVLIDKKVSWKINQDIGYNHISRNNLVASLGSLQTDTSSVFLGALFVDDKVYKALAYGLGTNINIEVTKTIDLGLFYKAILSFNFDEAQQSFNDASLVQDCFMSHTILVYGQRLNFNKH